MLKYASGCFCLLYHLALIEPFRYSSCEKENSLFLEKRKYVNILYSKKNKQHRRTERWWSFLCVTKRYLQHVLLILIPNLCPVNCCKQVISWLLGRQWVPIWMPCGCNYCVGDWGKDMWTAIFLADVSFFKTWDHIHIFSFVHLVIIKIYLGTKW